MVYSPLWLITKIIFVHDVTSHIFIWSGRFERGRLHDEAFLVTEGSENGKVNIKRTKNPFSHERIVFTQHVLGYEHREFLGVTDVMKRKMAIACTEGIKLKILHSNYSTLSMASFFKHRFNADIRCISRILQGLISRRWFIFLRWGSVKFYFMRMSPL